MLSHDGFFPHVFRVNKLYQIFLLCSGAEIEYFFKKNLNNQHNLNIQQVSVLKNLKVD